MVFLDCQHSLSLHHLSWCISLENIEVARYVWKLWYCGIFTIPINNVTVIYNHIPSKFVSFKDNIKRWLLFILAWKWRFSSKISVYLLVLSTIFWIHSERNVFRIDIGLHGSSNCNAGSWWKWKLLRSIVLCSWCTIICYSRTTTPNDVELLALIRHFFPHFFIDCVECEVKFSKDSSLEIPDVIADYSILSFLLLEYWVGIKVLS